MLVPGLATRTESGVLLGDGVAVRDVPLPVKPPGSLGPGLIDDVATRDHRPQSLKRPVKQMRLIPP